MPTLGIPITYKDGQPKAPVTHANLANLAVLFGTILLENGLGDGMRIPPADFTAEGGIFRPRSEILKFADMLLAMREIPTADLGQLPAGSTVLQVLPAADLGYYTATPPHVNFLCLSHLRQNDETRTLHPSGILDRARAGAITESICFKTSQAGKPPHESHLLFVGNTDILEQATAPFLSQQGFNIHRLSVSSNSAPIDDGELTAWTQSSLAELGDVTYDYMIIWNDPLGDKAAQLIASSTSEVHNLRYHYAINLTERAVPLSGDTEQQTKLGTKIRDVETHFPWQVSSQAASAALRWLIDMKDHRNNAILHSSITACMAGGGERKKLMSPHPRAREMLEHLRDRLNGR